jgi:hypothetical protein
VVEKNGELAPPAVLARPIGADDYAAWAAYHESQAARLAQLPLHPDQSVRIGELLGEMDQHAEAQWYREALEQRQVSYQASRQFAADPSSGIGAGKPPHSLNLERFYQGVNNYRMEREMPEQEQANGLAAEQIRAAYVPQSRTAEVPSVRVDAEVFSEKRAEIVVGSASAAVATAAEAGAATSYYRGQAETYNGFREAAIERNQAAAKDLPPALQVDEIRVRQVQQEQDRGEERSAGVSM